VAGGGVVVPAADFLLQLVHFARKKFHRTAALGADHVVMAAPVVLVLVAGDAVVEGDFAGQSALGQQFERAVDRGVADAGVFFLHQAVQFVGGEMVAGFQKGAQNGVALRGLLQADALEMRWRMSCASRTISREMEGWSSMRFCSMKGQDSIGHLENEIHFQSATRGESHR
jgi:hypothetical protein